MNRRTLEEPVPRLRLRYGDSQDDIVDIGWSPLPEEHDDDPPTIAFLRAGAVDPNAKATWDVEDPTDPANSEYPPSEAAELPPNLFVRCAASHWQRVHPTMRRFTTTELEAAEFLAALGAVRKVLDDLIASRHGQCSYKLEQHSTYR